MKKILIILLIYSIYTNSCVPIDMKQRFTYCYDAQYTGIDTLININGYYALGLLDRYREKDKNVHQIDTFYNNILFFRDGIFAHNAAMGNFNFINDTSSFSEQFVSNKNFIKDSLLLSCDWGRYIICGDTIKAQYINHPSLLTSTWMAYETWYKILNKNQLVYIKSKTLFNQTEQERSTFEKFDKERQKNYLLAIFIPLKVFPSSYCWLKEKKWFWCDKQAWKMYKKTRKK